MSLRTFMQAASFCVALGPDFSVDGLQQVEPVLVGNEVGLVREIVGLVVNRRAAVTANLIGRALLLS